MRRIKKINNISLPFVVEIPDSSAVIQIPEKKMILIKEGRPLFFEIIIKARDERQGIINVNYTNNKAYIKKILILAIIISLFIGTSFHFAIFFRVINNFNLLILIFFIIITSIIFLFYLSYDLFFRPDINISFLKNKNLTFYYINNPESCC